MRARERALEAEARGRQMEARARERAWAGQETGVAEKR